MNDYKRYIFDVRYIDQASGNTVGRTVSITGTSHLQAWIYCMGYMVTFLNSDLANLNEIEIVGVDEM